MLVLQIALGIVLAVIILKYLDVIIGLGMIAIVGLIAMVMAIVAFYYVNNNFEEVIGLASIALIFIVFFFIVGITATYREYHRRTFNALLKKIGYTKIIYKLFNFFLIILLITTVGTIATGFIFDSMQAMAWLIIVTAANITLLLLFPMFFISVYAHIYTFGRIIKKGTLGTQKL